MNNPEIFIWGIVAMAILGNLFLALWVYADAKEKGVKSSLCILLFILTLSNSMGAVIYAVFRNSLGQKSAEVVCRQCHARISNDVKFCPHCGAAHARLETNLPKKPKKYLLITGIMFISIVLLFAIGQIISETSSDSSHSLKTTMSVTTEYGNTWKMRFRTADGVGNHTFKVKGDGYGLIYSSNITEGEMKIDFCDAVGNVITEIPLNTSDTLRNVENGKKYKIAVTANHAKGAFSFKMRDVRCE